MGALRRAAALRAIGFLSAALLLGLSGVGQDPGDAPPEKAGEEKREAPEEWTENLFSFEPLRIDSSVREHQVAVTVHRWGSFTAPETFELVVEAKPDFIEEAWWAESDTLEFGPEETEKLVHLRFTLVEAGAASGELVFRIQAEDEDVSPRERRFVLPFGFGRERGAGSAFLLKKDAPEEIELESLHEWVDPGLQPIYACDDRLAVFFTPAVDLDAEIVAFRWSIGPAPRPETGAAGEGEGERTEAVDWGIYCPPDGVMHRELAVNPREDIPGKFLVELPRQYGSNDAWDALAGWRPGPFRVMTAPELESEDSLFGVSGSVPGEYSEVATFEFEPLPALEFAGVTTGAAQNVDLGALPWCHDGTLRMRAIASGRALRLEVEGSYRRVSDDDESRPEKERHEVALDVRIDFPETLSLGRSEPGDGEGEVACEKLVAGPSHGFRRPALRAFAGFGALVAVSDRQPGDWLFFDEELPRSSGTVHVVDAPEAPVLDGCPFSDSEVLEERIPDADTWKFSVSPWSSGEVGSPPRKLGFHLRDSATQWVLPVRLSFPSQADETDDFEVFAFAKYEVRE